MARRAAELAHAVDAAEYEDALATHRGEVQAAKLARCSKYIVKYEDSPEARKLHEEYEAAMAALSKLRSEVQAEKLARVVTYEPSSEARDMYEQQEAVISTLQGEVQAHKVATGGKFVVTPCFLVCESLR